MKIKTGTLKALYCEGTKNGIKLKFRVFWDSSFELEYYGNGSIDLLFRIYINNTLNYKKFGIIIKDRLFIEEIKNEN